MQTRYLTRSDLLRDRDELNLQFTERRVNWMLNYSLTKRFKHPPLLTRLPEIIPFPLQIHRRKEILETTQRLVQESFSDVAYLFKVVGEILGLANEDRPVQPLDVMHAGLVFFDEMRRHLLRIVKTGRTTITENDLRMAIICLVLAMPENHDLGRRLSRIEGEKEKFEKAFGELIGKRSQRFIDTLAGAKPGDLAYRLCHRVQKLAPAGKVRMGLTQIITAIKSWEDFEEAVEKRVPAWYRRNGIGQEASERVVATLRSGLDDRRAISELWKKLFDGISVEMLDHRLGESLRLQRIVTETGRRLETVDETIEGMTLVPSKDWLEMMKGMISSDCTDEPANAWKHLGVTEFFNLRVYDSEKWIGNIYCLDTTATTGDLVIDRVQFPKKYDKRWNLFTALQAVCGKFVHEGLCKRVVCPTRISNHIEIQKTWESFVNRKRLAVVLNLLENSRKFRSFEGVWKRPGLNVLVEGRLN